MIDTPRLTDAELVRLALDARDRAYAPYSGFRVGAALECDDGSVVIGCNVENASYGATICAERTAFASAIALGKRGFARLAVASSGDDFCLPCGICLQVIAEHAPDIVVLCAKPTGEWVEHSIKKLLPHAFFLGT